MALSFVQYTGDGSTATFAVPFPYIAQSHIQVKVDGVLKTASTDYTFPTSSTLQFTTAPLSGLIVEIKRVTPRTNRLVDFQDASTLTEATLDQDSNQNFFVAQEAFDLADSNIKLTPNNTFDAEGLSIKNLGAPMLPTDAVRVQDLTEDVGSVKLRADLNDTVDVTKGAALVPTAIRHIGSVAALRALPIPTSKVSVNLLGYTTPNDGGDGHFYWDKDSNSADNGDTVICPDGYTGAGRWRRLDANALRLKAEVQTLTDEAKAARDAAIIQAGVYSDEPTGRAAVTDGQAFKVQGNADVAAYEYRRVDATTSTLIATYPSKSYVETRLDSVGINNNGRPFYLDLGNGTQWVLPLVVDDSGKLVLAYDDQGHVVCKLSNTSVTAIGYDVSDSVYANSKAYSFAIADEQGKVLLAFDKDGKMVDSDLFVDSLFSSREFEQYKYPVEGKYAFAVVDETGRVALSVDKNGVVNVGNLDGKEWVAPTLPDVKKHALPVPRADFNHVMISGQSLSVGWDFTGGALLSTSQPYNNKMMGNVIDVVPTATAFSPLVEARSGDRGETVASGAANQTSMLLNQSLRPWDSYRLDWVMSANGVGGASIDALGKTTSAYNLGLDCITGAKNICVTSGESYRARALFWIQGETDTGNMSEDIYKPKLLQLKNDWNTDAMAITGQAERIPMFSYQVMYHASESVYSNFGGPVAPGPALAQYRLAKQDPEVFLVAPIYIFPYSDGSHLTNHGYRWLGHYFGKAMHRVFVEQRPWIPLWPIAVTKSGSRTIDVQFHVPCPPLVFDVIAVAEATNYGFDVVTSTGVDRPLEGVAKVAWDTIRLYCADDCLVGDVVRYAVKTYNKGIGPQTGPRGNLRDSDPALAQDTGPDGKPYPLYNWAVLFSEPVTN